MDIKLTNNKKGWLLGVLISLALLSVISCVMIGLYPSITQRMNQESQTEISEKDIEYPFIEELHSGIYGIIWDEYYSNNEETITQLFLKLNDDINTNNGLDIGEYDGSPFIDDFHNTIGNWHARFFDSTIYNYQLDYYYRNNETGHTSTNSLNDLTLFEKGGKRANDLKELYGFYAVYQFDEKGEMSIPVFEGLKAIDKNSVIDMNKNYFRLYYEGTSWSRYSNLITTPENATIIFAAGDKNYYSDILEARMKPNYYNYWEFNHVGFLGLFLSALFITGVLALFLPLIKPLQIGYYSSKIPLELSMIGFFITALCYNPLLSVAGGTASGNLIFERDFWFAGIIKITPQIMTYTFNYLAWMFVITIWYVVLLSWRSLLVKGPKRFIKENIFVVRVLIYMKNKAESLIKNINDIDFKNSFTKAIIGILVLNYIAVAVTCFFWIFGLVLLVPYSIFIFYLLNKYIKNVQKKYDVIMEAASKMANGNLEISIHEDAGMFEGLKQVLVKVQSGFKKAVQEEMKSQNMKTELITNVSHDLKTPLTAIITYVDLLKDEAVSAEDRKSYIETIDQKCNRLKNLIEDLFEVSKATSNTITLNKMDIDLVALVKQVLLELDSSIKDAGIEFRNNFPKDKVILSLDSEKTYRIFENLTTNIIKYSLPNTRAYIDINILEGDVEIIYKNISAVELKVLPNDLTERFVRGDKSRNTEGSGLGLAIAKSFAELQGGSFTIQVDGDLFKVVIRWKS